MGISVPDMLDAPPTSTEFGGDGLLSTAVGGWKFVSHAHTLSVGLANLARVIGM